MDRPTTLTATARDAGGRPLPGRTVQLERGGGRLWTRVGTLTTVADGTATLPTRLPTPSTTYRAILMPAAAGDVAYASAPRTVTAPPAPTTTTLTAPASVVDERTVRLDIASSTTADGAGAGVAVPARVTVERRLGNGAWTPAATVQLSTAGTGSFTFAPRVTASYRVTTPAGAFWTGSVSSPRTITNLPPGTVVHLPAGSPQPRSMAAQPRATTAGVGAVVGAISSAQWARMSGISWHSGCPVGRSGLRTVDVNYWAFDGYRRRGRLVVNARAVKQYVAAFTGLYNARVPIRRIYPSETFGYAKASHGANDYLAMQSDNTSAFNCRWVTGRPGVNSPHSTGYAVDINTFENPYHTVKDGWLPNTWWPARSFGLIAWRSQSAVVVSIMRRSGFAWTYGTQDSQHFDVRR
ncbi:hypothetical protein GCM10011519_00260 [Marmoricola endophyticus]|uniref:Peptidase M15C domain-containing protein n=2 Tax=Marmoricola endophyticus TaxID=2040280 RepID=A0A917B806_9ACTN|nr:hypothetical protein GCM10011519_00260 [Marmoricola endophyticus]